MATRTAPPPPLESGDHLSRREFHRRYLARPDIKRAELIEGVVYVSSPVSADHSLPHASVIGWLYVYKSRTPGVALADNGTILMGDDSEVQPDACLYREPPHGNVRVIVKERGTRYLQGAPGLIVEVAVSSASYDLHSKLRLYEGMGVPEYVVWQVYERRIDWFRLSNGRYVRVEPDKRGVIESSVFPDLRLAVAKLLAGDDAGVIAELLDAQR
ncbi:MAG: Uma2 family endonuclease [Dehalococcoidia bacterium]